MHAEDSAINWASSQIREYVRSWGSRAAYSDFTVILITSREPCPRCAGKFHDHVWLDWLLDAASGKLPGAIGGNSGIRVKLWVWYIIPYNRDPFGTSLLWPYDDITGELDDPTYYVKGFNPGRGGR